MTDVSNMILKKKHTFLINGPFKKKKNNNNSDYYFTGFTGLNSAKEQQII